MSELASPSPARRKSPRRAGAAEPIAWLEIVALGTGSAIVYGIYFVGGGGGILLAGRVWIGRRHA